MRHINKQFRYVNKHNQQHFKNTTQPMLFHVLTTYNDVSTEITDRWIMNLCTRKVTRISNDNHQTQFSLAKKSIHTRWTTWMVAKHID